MATADVVTQPGTVPSPAHFFETINAYQRSAALKAAIELDLFTAIGEGDTTAEAIARRCQASPRGTRILCDYLVIIGFLTKDAERYALNADSAAFLDRRSPYYIAGAIEFLASPQQTANFENLAEVVRKGGTVASELGNLEPEHPVWVKFARAMAPVMALPAEMIAQRVAADPGNSGRRPVRKVLDIAAGHGVYGIALARHNPEAEVTAVDWPNVLEVAKENAAAVGVSARYKTIPGSALEVEFGSGYDVVLVTNFLHHFDAATCERLLAKVHAALADSGRAVTLEIVPNEDRVSPPVPAAFSMMMLGTTPAGDAHTFAELEQMFRNAGFRSSEIHPLPPTFYSLLISRK